MSQITIRYRPLVPEREITVTREEFDLMGVTALALADAEMAAFDGELEVEMVAVSEARCEECNSARPASCLCAGGLSDDDDALEVDYAQRARDARESRAAA